MLYQFRGFHGYESHCDIQVNGNVVMCTELISNPGTSVTNFAENLATEVCNRSNIAPQDLIWIESYQRHGDYDYVTFEHDGRRFSSPNWKRITPDQANQIWTTGVLPW
jgi:hypothetical protein